MGRPTLLTKTIAHPQLGTITVGDYLVSRIQLGLTITSACKAANVSDRSVASWRLRGATAAQLEEDGQEVPDDEVPYLQFLRAFEAAEAQAKADLLQGIYDAGTKPQQVKKVTIRKALVDGVMTEVERSESVEERPPLWTARAWLAERRWPGEFGRRLIAEGAADGGPTAEERAVALEAEIDAYRQGIADGEQAAAEATIDVAEVE